MKRYAIVSKKDDVSRHLAALIRDELKELIYDEEHPDIVISMGCKGGCPYIGRGFNADWDLEDPTGQSEEAYVEVIRKIQNHLKVFLPKE